MFRVETCIICNEPLTKYDRQNYQQAALSSQQISCESLLGNQPPICRECVKTGRADDYMQRAFSQGYLAVSPKG